MKETAGSLLHRLSKKGMEVLLVHPSGNYNKNRPWSIPKGLPEPGETLEQAARRETMEETGIVPGELFSLGHIDYKKSRKRVHCFAGLAPAEAEPEPCSWEVDKAEFVSLEKAKRIIHPDQLPFLVHLAAL